jgi:exodeoxyribonuclease V
MSEYKLSVEQQTAFDEIMNFVLNTDQQAFVLSGVAGSGKTEIIKRLNKALLAIPNFSITNCAITGRAVSVLQNKLHSLKHYSEARTLHSLLYEAVVDRYGNFIEFRKRDPKEIRLTRTLFIVDEASMVTQDIFKDLMDVKLPVLFVGDKEQLPPIDSDDFNVMNHYDVHLNNIHRQAEGNPIIALSRIIRETGKINIPSECKNICAVRKHDVTKSFIKDAGADIILTGTNAQRMKMYRLSRIAKGYSPEGPEIGENIICLKNSVVNGIPIYNGELYSIVDIMPHNEKSKQFCLRKIEAQTDRTIWVNIDNRCWDENPVVMEGISRNNGFGVFTYGDAISVWKAQGSEFNTVMFFDEDVSYFVDQRRFRYTAVTRAKEKLIIAQ